MKNIENGSIVYLWIQIFLFSVMAIIIWPLLDLFICKVFTRSEFVYSVVEHIIKPIIFGVMAGFVFWLFDKKKKLNYDTITKYRKKSFFDIFK